MDRIYFLDGFNFNHDAVGHHQVQAVATIELYAFVGNRKRLLLFDVQAALAKFKNQTSFVGRFQQSRTNCAMNFHGSTDNLLGERVELIGLNHRSTHEITFSAYSAISAVKCPTLRRYGYSRCNMRGNGIVSRTCSKPQIQATARSMPMPNPECGTLPYLRRSRYHLKASSGRLCSRMRCNSRS